MHYNLYYLFREDQQNNPIDPDAELHILRVLAEFLQKAQDPDTHHIAIPEELCYTNKKGE